MSSAARSSPWSSAALGRAAIYVLPAASVLVATLVFLGPGVHKPVMAARVRGLPADGGHAVALRVEVVRCLHDVVENGGAHELLVEGSAPGQALRAWHGQSGPDGIAEVRLEAGAPVRGPVAVGVSSLSPKPTVLAAGEIPLSRAPAPLVVPASLVGSVRGDLGIRVDVSRGILAAPFPEVIRVLVSPAGLSVPLGTRADVELSGLGLEAAPSKATTDERGAAAFRVKALAHQVELVVEARAGDKTAHWEGALPVLPGAMWLSLPGPLGGSLALLSPVPRERAYISFWSEEGRVAGAVVPLARDVQGFHAGEVAVPKLPSARVLYAVVAGDAHEQGSGTVAWPIVPSEGVVTPQHMTMLLDGLPAAQDREKQRTWATRKTGLVLIGAAALAEVLLLLLQGRASQRRLEAHLEEASGPMPEADRARLMGAAREHPLLRALTAVTLVGLAFAMVAALSTFR
jgi:hypothetical protein